METRKLKLTTATIRPHLGKPCILWDSTQPGLGLAIRAKSATFMLMRMFRGKTIKLTIGRFGVWTADSARRRARELVAKMDQGIDPRAEERQARARGATLREAMGWHVDSMRTRGCAQRSMDDVPDELERHLGDWLDRPLTDITTDDCVARHRKVGRRGPYVANRVMRHLRAIWKTADRRRDLPRCPVRAVTFNRERRRREPIDWDELTNWWRAVEDIESPVVRDLQWFILFTGLRKSDARTVKWTDVNLQKGTIHRPRPKGGPARAFTVPVCAFVLELLRRRRAENRELFPEGDGGWVFPARDRQGQVVHVYEARVMRYRNGVRLPAKLPSPHRLRDTFAGAAHEARLHPLDLKILMNHTLPAGGDVTEGHIRPSPDHLRDCVEKVARFLLDKAGVKQPAHRDAG